MSRHPPRRRLLRQRVNTLPKEKFAALQEELSRPTAGDRRKLRLDTAYPRAGRTVISSTSPLACLRGVAQPPASAWWRPGRSERRLRPHHLDFIKYVWNYRRTMRPASGRLSPSTPVTPRSTS